MVCAWLYAVFSLVWVRCVELSTQISPLCVSLLFQDHRSASRLDGSLGLVRHSGGVLGAGYDVGRERRDRSWMRFNV